MGIIIAKFLLGDSFSKFVIYERSGEKGSIVEYDADALLDVLWVFAVPGSIFTRRIVFSCMFAIALATALANGSCLTHPKLERCFPATTDSDGKVGWQNLTLLRFSGFLTAIFTVEIFKRWWSIRVLLQGVFGKANSIVTTIAASFSVTLCRLDSQEAKDARTAQEQITRYLNLAHSLIYKACENNRNIDDLVRDDCATQVEVESLSRIENIGPDHVYSWISILLHRMGKAGLLGDMKSVGKVNLKLLLTDLEIIRQNSSLVITHIHTQMPLCFLQLLVVVVYSFTLQAILVAASIIAQGMVTEDYTVIATGYVTLTAMVFVFMSLLEIYRLLHSPLEDSAAGFPVYSFRESSGKGYKSLILMASELSYRKITKDISSPVKPLIHFRVKDMIMHQ